MNEARDEGLNEVFPGIFVGDVAAGADDRLLKRHGITHVLDVSDLEDPKRAPKDIKRVQVVLVDEEGNRAASYIEAVEYLARAKYDDARVLVHCMAGVSRSPSVALGYVLRYQRHLIEDVDSRNGERWYVSGEIPESIKEHPLYENLRRGFAAMFARRPQVWINPKFWTGLLPEIAEYLERQKDPSDYGLDPVVWP